jgi:hypothetical protein
MNHMARVRQVLARRPWLYWSAVLAVAAGLGLVVADAMTAVDDARHEWGTERAVLVATRDARPGERLSDIAARRPLPAPMVPAAAIETAPPDAVLRQHVSAGEIVTGPDMAATAQPQALIEDGSLAVAVAERVPTGAAVGDAVAVASGGVVLAGDGTVVGVLSDAVLVAVPAAEAPAVAQAAGAGDVALLLRP